MTHVSGAVETGHTGPPLNTDSLYPTASRGTGTAIISRWISHGHQTTQGYSDVFYKGTWGERADLYQHSLHVTGLLVVKCTGRWRRSNLCRWASLERYFLSSSCQKRAVLLELHNRYTFMHIKVKQNNVKVKNIYSLYLLSWLNLHLQCPPVIMAKDVFKQRESKICQGHI